ncbi:hypothetical protein F2Q70_00015753 [Brassica cretica]|uniref:Uncharacterized protein n=1 Tax=Brassica cretica TaxID=69181 RepID=A0A3N6TZ88_BRACR|nr:hypothetical protein F2Q70_00015753 [Brassica cretica]KAF2599077.1 hypothetical protein F2Q68_00008685 [Brassica cretica]
MIDVRGPAFVNCSPHLDYVDGLGLWQASAVHPSLIGHVAPILRMDLVQDLRPRFAPLHLFTCLDSVDGVDPRSKLCSQSPYMWIVDKLDPR